MKKKSSYRVVAPKGASINIVVTLSNGYTMTFTTDTDRFHFKGTIPESAFDACKDLGIELKKLRS